MVKLVVSLLQLSKMAVNHTGEREVLGKLLGLVNMSFFCLSGYLHSILKIHKICCLKYWGNVRC